MRQAGIFSLRCVICLVVFSVIFFFAFPTAFAQANSMDVFVDGVEAFEAGDYHVAMASLKQAIAMDPENDEFRYYQALTYSKLKNRKKALVIFRSLIDKDPVGYRKAYFDIAAIYSNQSQYEKALKVLEKAIQMDPKDARAYMEAGVVQKSLGQNAQAINNLQTASSLDPRQAPTANLIMAAIYLDDEDFDKAEQLFRQVVQTDAGTPIALAATKSLEAVSRTRRARKCWYINSMFQIGYDDNVLNEPLDAVTVQSTSDKEDTFQTLFVETGFRAINKKEFRLGGSFAVNTMGYQDVPSGNILSYTPLAFLEVRKGTYFLRFSYDFSYYYTGGEDHTIQDNGWFLTFNADHSQLMTHRVMSTFSVVEPYGFSSVINLAWIKKDYFDLTPDADCYQAGFTQNYNIYKTPVVARIGYDLYWEDATRSSYSYYSHTGKIGLACSFPYGITGDMQYSTVRTHYDESPVIVGTKILFWDGDRKDTQQSFTASVAKSLGEIVKITGSYYYGYNDSNVISRDTQYKKIWDPYEFKRNTYTLAVSALF